MSEGLNGIWAKPIGAASETKACLQFYRVISPAVERGPEPQSGLECLIRPTRPTHSAFSMYGR